MNQFTISSELRTNKSLPHAAWAQSAECITPFGAFVQWLLAKRKLTQRDFAHAVGMAPSYLSTILRGKKGAPPQLLIQKVIKTLRLNHEESLLLGDAAQLSATGYELAELHPWQYALAASFHSALPHLSRETGDIINLMLALGNRQLRHDNEHDVCAEKDV